MSCRPNVRTPVNNYPQDCHVTASDRQSKIQSHNRLTAWSDAEIQLDPKIAKNSTERLRLKRTKLYYLKPKFYIVSGKKAEPMVYYNNFNKFRYIFIIFGMNNLDTAFY